jgi:O-antigen/teichoic acid export membrane protein
MATSVHTRILRNTASLTLGRLISRIFLFFLMIYAARVLGVEKYGVFSYAFALVGLFAVSMDLGISRYSVQQLSRDHTKIPVFMGGSLMVKAVLICFGLSLIMSTGLIMHRDKETMSILIILASYVALDSLTMTFTSVFQAVQRMSYQAILVSISNIVMSLMGFLFLYLMPNVLLFSVIYLFGGLLRLILVSWWCIRMYGAPHWVIDFGFCRNLLRKGIPFSLVTIFVTIYYYIDTIILSAYSGNDVVGYYSAAYRLLEAPLFLVAAFTTAIFPAASKLFVENKQHLKSIVSIGFQKALVFSSLLSLIIAFFSDELIAVLYGTKYQQSSVVLSILIFSVAIIMPSTILGTTIRAIDKQVVSAWVTGIGAALNIVLNLIFIPRFSLIGAACTTVFTELFVIITYAILIWRYVGPIFKVGFLLRYSLICSFVIAFLYFTVNFGLWVQLLCLGIFLLPLLLLLGLVKLDELKGLIEVFFVKKRNSF